MPDEPQKKYSALWMPAGSVRALVFLGFAGTICWAALNGGAWAQEVMKISFSAIMGFYFAKSQATGPGLPQ